MASRAALLEVRDLCVTFKTSRGALQAVDRVSFDLSRGEVLGLVGESGSGKSVTALSVSRLIPESTGQVVATALNLDGENLLAKTSREMGRTRGRKIGFVFQNPLSSLNPLMPVGEQIAEAMRVHLGLSRRDARARAMELLAKVGIPDPRTRSSEYPHQFSGGMRQRVMIAMAISCEPLLLLADEPTTALDVTIQAQILELLHSLATEFGMAMILITHDLGIAASMCQRVGVMYAGQMVESAGVDEIFHNPRMPYTWGLLDSLPRSDQSPGLALRVIKGLPPDPMDVPSGCRFAPRCEYSRDVCRETAPSLEPQGADEHEVRCWGTRASGWIEVYA